mgnify:CR=1 FL=1|jgi:hypothetical protein
MGKLKSAMGRDPVHFWICLGIPVIIIIGSLMHPIYQWSGNSKIAGIFVPVNESVWEHLKMGFWPMLLWWLTGYLLFGNGGMHFAVQWFSSGAIALLSCPAVILSFFYTYTGALGIESLALDILSFILGVFAAQLIARHAYQCVRYHFYCLYISYSLIILMALFFILFTFFTPRLPLFLDFSTGKYGIG